MRSQIKVYERVVADVTAIRALEPELADVGYFSPHDGKHLYGEFDDVTTESIRAGDYHAWDCLNDFYGLKDVTVGNRSFGDPPVFLTFGGIYALEYLAGLYAELPGARAIEPNYAVGDGPTLCASRDGSRYEYVVDRASGDCPAGCIEHDARRFASDAPGDVSFVDAWDGESGEPAPDWFAASCR